MADAFHMHHRPLTAGKNSAREYFSYLTRQGEKWEHKADSLVYSESGNLPAWAEGDPAKFWAAADQFGKGRIGEEVEFSLPHSLAQEQRIEVAKRHVDRIVNGSAGHAKQPYTYSIHSKGDSGRPNWHVHVMFHAGIEDGIERGPEQWFKAPSKNYRHRVTKELIQADPTKGGVKKNRRFSSIAYIKMERQDWERTCNQYFREHGVNSRIDSRSYKEQGSPFEPGIHLGPSVLHHPDKESLEVYQNYLAIQRRNGDKIIADPTIAIDFLTEHHSTFTQREIQVFAHTYSADTEQWEAVCRAIENHEQSVCIGIDRNQINANTGEIHEEKVFSSATVLAAENSMLSAADNLHADQASHRVSQANRDQAASLKTMSADQQKAFDHILDSGRLSCVSGVAGAGKSYMLDGVRDAYEREGYRVRGVALAGIAAEALEQSSGIQSQTIHSFLYKVEEGKDALTKSDILVVDEAGMVGSRQMQQLVNLADESGAKLVLVGDSRQLQSVEYGGAFKAFSQKYGQAEISQVRRQQEVWQQWATAQFSRGQVAAALHAYDHHDMVHESEKQTEAQAALIAKWAEDRREGQSSLILASTNADVQALNDQARAAISQELGHAESIETAKGQRELAVNDRIVFLKNDRQLGVKNGSLGTLRAIENGELVVELDDKSTVAFKAEDYSHIDHGYALTVHKSQGQTVDRAYVLGSHLMDAQASYVALTRHREEAHLFYSKEVYQDPDDTKPMLEQVAQSMGRTRLKGLAADYALKQGTRLDQEDIQAKAARHQEMLLKEAQEQQGEAARQLQQQPTKPPAAPRQEPVEVRDPGQAHEVARGREEREPAEIIAQERQQQLAEAERERRQVAAENWIQNVSRDETKRADLAAMYCSNPNFRQIKDPELRRELNTRLERIYTSEWRARQLDRQNRQIDQQIDQKYAWLHDPQKVQAAAIPYFHGKKLKALQDQESPIQTEHKAAIARLQKLQQQLDQTRPWQLNKKQELRSSIADTTQQEGQLASELEEIEKRRQQLQHLEPAQEAQYRQTLEGHRERERTQEKEKERKQLDAQIRENVDRLRKEERLNELTTKGRTQTQGQAQTQDQEEKKQPKQSDRDRLAELTAKGREQEPAQEEEKKKHRQHGSPGMSR